ncbi:D-alanyl-D-alanine carboxypeptidase [Erysipelothrix sp. HDW6C]|uniref:D-alanyl-D-alanine carboxypeptidase family protein n=1 Tax=Erysipelothrix sp. HDW6C TaxID=2714930 RepID=UPI0014092824|nr:serine hydrolase [Erysipelothrix sp. HDW6C]QIK69969.1 D-alanyl-D-alanine carboxypeptidase [Erysipelothrix sp. HDW6C]
MKRILTFFLVLGLLTGVSAPVHAEIKEDIIPLDTLMLYSSNYLLMDQDDGTILAQNNGYERVSPASITKVLTVITALEMMESQNISLQETYLIPDEVFDGLSSIASIADFDRGDTVVLEDVLYGIMLPSGADATRTLSMRLTGDPEGLSKYMNELAMRIGMTNSNFENTSGLDDENHYSTPYELALLVQYALRNETFKKIYTTETHTTKPLINHPDGISFTNLSLYKARNLGSKTLKGAKSGYTENAERALSSVASKDGTNLIFISTNAPNEETESTAVLDAVNVYNRVFDDFNKTTVINAKTIIKEIPVTYSKEDFPVIFENDVTTYLPKDLSLDDVIVTVTPASTEFVAPVEAGTVMGTLTISYSNKIVHEQTLLATDTIPVRLSKVLLDYCIAILKIVGIAILILIALIFMIREINRARYRKRRERRRAEIMKRRAQQQNE